MGKEQTVRNCRKQIFLTAAAALCCAAGCRSLESVPLGGVPYSDSEIRNGSFRSGVSLQLDGQVVTDAVAIDSYGSLVYNLDGMAESFSADVGPGAVCRDEVRLDIIVDRKRCAVFQFGPETPRRRITIPLSGVQQLELSIQYGPGYKAQTLVFSNAEFCVRNKSAFLEHMARQRALCDQERDLPPENLPDVPEWRSVTVTPFLWNGSHPAFRIGNGFLEYEVAPSFGGRLVGFRRAGGGNILEQPRHPLPADLRRGRSYYRQHTRFARSEPAWYFLPGEDLHLFGPYELRFGKEGECIMTSRPSRFLQFRVEYRFRLAPGSRELEVMTVFHNLGSYVRPCGIWSVAVLPTDSIDRILLPESSRNLDSPADAARLWLREGKLCSLSVAGIPFEKQESVERRSWSNDQYICVKLKSGEHFSMRNPDGNRKRMLQNHIYAARLFTELEFHSGEIDLKAGECIAFREVWCLLAPRDGNQKEE